MIRFGIRECSGLIRARGSFGRCTPNRRICGRVTAGRVDLLIAESAIRIRQKTGLDCPALLLYAHFPRYHLHRHDRHQGYYASFIIDDEESSLRPGSIPLT